MFYVLIATIGQCYNARTSYATPAPTYNYAVQTQWLPPYQIYGTVVADNQASVQTTGVLTKQLSKLDESINKLEARLVAATAPQQQQAPPPRSQGPSPQFQAQVPLKSPPPSKQTPEFGQPRLPSKQAPEFGQPNLPDKQTPDFNQPVGSVPPPPRTNNTSNSALAVSSIFANKCKSCHAVDRYQSSGGGFRLFDEDGFVSRNLTVMDKLRIDDQVYNGLMPKDSTPLPPDDYDAVRSWVNEDRDEIRALIRSVSR